MKIKFDDLPIQAQIAYAIVIIAGATWGIIALMLLLDRC